MRPRAYVSDWEGVSTPLAERGSRAKMLERFPERDRRVIILAQEEAKRHHSALGTEHILLASSARAEALPARSSSL